MTGITAEAVRRLRERTSAGMMDCKRALTETGGDLEAAIDVLRKKGAAGAARKAGRSANEGLIACRIDASSRSGVLVEVNCETDFVARNETFTAFCDELAGAILSGTGESELEERRTDQVTRMGENIRIGRHTRMDVSGIGLVAAYIHTGGKIGVLVEVGAGRKDTVRHESFARLVKDITLQIAAANPLHVGRNDVPDPVVEREKGIAEEQARGKPPRAVSRIVEGKLEKFFQAVCLLDQGFVRRNGEITIGEHLAEVGRELGDPEIRVRNFLRYQVGEEAGG